MLHRAWDIGVEKIMVTAGCLKDVDEALLVCAKHTNLCTTVGVHPTRCMEFLPLPLQQQFQLEQDAQQAAAAESSSNATTVMFTPEELETYANDHMQKLIAKFSSKNDNEKNNSSRVNQKIVAIGEFGLDYDRLHFCPRNIQQQFFERQLVALCGAMPQLPLFLHNRASTQDFMDIINRHAHLFSYGVVHSFTGTEEELNLILANKKLFIGVNGCSLKTPENLLVVKQIPLDRIMIETDAPYCDIRSTHASFKFMKTQFAEKKREKFEKNNTVKGRNEPCRVVYVQNCCL